MLVTPDWVRLMARYSAWQNGAQIRLVRTLREEGLTRDRGAFWGSILGTLNHLLWGDRIWLHRLAGLPRPEVGLDGSARFAPDITVWSEERERTDADLSAWAETLSISDLEGDLSWNSPAAGRTVSKPRALLVTHLFNHGTHHRGQVHAMLTAAGARPEPTDLPFMPD